MATTIEISKQARTSARDYIPALLFACQQAGRKGQAVDPVRVLRETAEYPGVVKGAENAEFIVGWIHALAEQLEVKIELLWAHLAAEYGQPPTPKTRAKSPKTSTSSPEPAKPAVRTIAELSAPTRGATGKVTIVEPQDVPRVFAASGTAAPPAPIQRRGRRVPAAQTGLAL